MNSVKWSLAWDEEQNFLNIELCQTDPPGIQSPRDLLSIMKKGRFKPPSGSAV